MSRDKGPDGEGRARGPTNAQTCGLTNHSSSTPAATHMPVSAASHHKGTDRREGGKTPGLG